MSTVPPSVCCQFCREPLTRTLVDLGKTPLSNSYLAAKDLDRPEGHFPLHTRVCGKCRLVQVEAAATPAEIFGHYAYFSSYSTSWVDHARRFSELARARWGLNEASKVVEVASNDGYLLRHFVAAGVPVLGVEPAANVAESARAAGVETDVAFFGLETAQRLKNAGHAADLLVGNNVFAHVPDINDFTAGLACLLKPDGVLSLEFPHLLRLIEDVQFDTIYHEHFSYLSLLTTERIFAAHGLRVFDVAELPTHGGSLRVMACLAASTAHPERPGLAKVRLDEERARLDQDEGYEGFAPKVTAVCADLQAFLRQAQAEGRTVAAYGAAAKGNTLLNCCGITAEQIICVVDRNPHKQGCFMPGSRIPIHAPEKLTELKPDYVLILPWNIKDEITAQMAEVRGWGGQFVIAIPSLTLLP